MRKSEAGAFGDLFHSLRRILERHARTLSVSEDTSTKYCLEAAVGPATLRAWGGKARRPRIPIAWVEVGKSSVSYHLMGVSIPAVQSRMSDALKARMQGKTCFNFTISDPALLTELDSMTEVSIAEFRKAGFTA
jgi:hypothetical protein